MAVYTEVSRAEASALLQELQLGSLHDMQGCAGGIENTNYFVTSQTQGPNGMVHHEHVLTLFERLGFEQLPFYLRLMQHLAHKGIPVPDPQPKRDGDLVFWLQGKPAALVNRLRGRSELAPSLAHCHAMGQTLARMHLAGRDFNMHQDNLRGLEWWNETVPIVLPHLDAAQAALVLAELAFQNHVAAQSVHKALPRGPIHADLFRDNVLFEDVNGTLTLTGIFDFYFAGTDAWLFDLAVCLNDWCMDHVTGVERAAHRQALLQAYASVRPLAAAERQLLPAMLRAAALRFWISRLWDLHLPRAASMLKAHDPEPFERILRQRIAHPVSLTHTATADAALSPV